MNEVIRQLAARKSVRAFEDRDIPGEVRAAILEAAAQAPTAGNQQLYTILDGQPAGTWFEPNLQQRQQRQERLKMKSRYPNQGNITL